MFKDILVPVDCFPDALPAETLETTADLAARFRADVTVVTFDLVFPAPASVLANAFLDGPAMVAAARENAAVAAGRALWTLQEALDLRGVSVTHRKITCGPSEEPDFVARLARAYDITMVPGVGLSDGRRWLAEAVAFGSGRPIMVMPDAPSALPVPGHGFRRVLVAWDNSRPAARALADALPVLNAAAEVHVVAVQREKELPHGHGLEEIQRHLARHGITASCGTVDAAGRSIGEALSDTFRERDCSMLVMGAWGHSRLREFILGGATRSLVEAPPGPVLMSH